MLTAAAVDVLQADATRCLGISGFLAASTLADAFGRGRGSASS
jgi:L-alanine-DL-glutamate epimerase-like enolase superfamily enzyme